MLTILSGLTLYWRVSDGFQSTAWLASGTAKVLGAGGLLAIVASVAGMVVSSPTAKRMAGLSAAVRAAGGPPSAEQLAEIQRLQNRLFTVSRIAAALLVLATAAMAIARSVP
ncbi:MAG TPA: hypothetical protein VGT98_05995 [Candidatus Elarobacter sp.]|nr:hypothetical protein [Candidatus Elarobacter sp.]